MKWGADGSRGEENEEEEVEAGPSREPWEKKRCHLQSDWERQAMRHVVLPKNIGKREMYNLCVWFKIIIPY